MHQPAFRPGAMGHTKPQTPLMGKHVLDPPDALGPSPYDPAAGFVIFYDFLMGLEPSLRMVRLVAGLYNSGQEMGRPTPLPGVHCEVGGALQYVTEGYPGNLAVLSVKQPVPRVRPSPSISLVVELQASGGFDAYGQEIQRLVTRGWTKIDIFDHHNQVISGFWKIPIRVLPVRPSLTTGQLNGVPQTGGTELYLRVVNARDVDMQSLANMDPGNALAYKYPSMVSARTVAHAENPPLHLTPYHPSTNHYLSVPSHIDQIDPPPVEPGPVQHRANQSVPEVSAQTGAAEEPDEKSVGFIVDRVSDAPSGDGSLRLTGYSQRTGRVIFTKHSGMVCSTSAVKSSIKQGCFIFGEQEMIFRGVEPQADMVLIVRFYHWPGGSDATAPWDGDGSLQGLSDREECAVAWGTLALTRPAAPHKHSRVCAEVVWNSGTHSVPLYHVPAPPAIGLNALPGDRLVEAFEAYGTASVRLHMYSGTRPEFPFPPESPIDTRVYQEWPNTAFIYRQRERAPSQPFVSGDGIELYIDGARFLPDSVTLSRVTGRIFNRNYNQIGPDISTGIDLNSNIFEPFYNHHVEVRNPTMPPSATLLLKVYAVDRFSLKLVLIGWAALSLFVESGSESQPSVDTTAVQISLNEGAHQLRLYHRGPDPDKPLSASSLAAGGGRRVPCASLLVRLVKAPVDKNHRALLRSAVPEADWERLGLFQPRPRYSDGVYYSDTAKPSQGEACLHSAMTNRSVVLVREILDLIAGSRAQELGSDLEISEWIKDKLNRMMDSKPKPFDLDHVSRYLTSYGVKVSVDRAKNLPWPAFTLALCSFSPPAAFYHGASRVRYDRPAFVEKLDFNSSQSAPVWLDGFKSFPKRIHDKFLAVVVHLHTVSVHLGQDAPRKDKRDKKEKREESEREVLTYSLGAQAWTALPVFSRGYCHTGVYQLPLYQGAPSQAALAALSQGECRSVLGDLVQKNKVQRLKGASVFVRIADGRRDEELEGLSEKETDQCYLPPDQRDSYSVEHGGAGLSQLIPAGKSRDEFPGQLANRFRQLVYQTLRNTAENSTGPALMKLSKDGVETAALPPLPAPHARTADLKPNPTNTAQPSNAAPHILQTPSLRIPRSESAQQHPPKPPSAPPPPELLRARVPSSL